MYIRNNYACTRNIKDTIQNKKNIAVATQCCLGDSEITLILQTYKILVVRETTLYVKIKVVALILIYH